MSRGFLSVLLILLALIAPASSLGAQGDDDRQSDAFLRVQAMYESYRARSFPDGVEISVADAAVLADSADVLWLDVRSARERRVSLIRGALDVRSFEAQRRPEDTRPVIVYCTVGYRSGLATLELRERGIEAYNLAGGLLAWIHADGALVDGRSGAATRRVHVYGRRWNLVPPQWQAEW